MKPETSLQRGEIAFDVAPAALPDPSPYTLRNTYEAHVTLLAEGGRVLDWAEPRD